MNVTDVDIRRDGLEISKGISWVNGVSDVIALLKFFGKVHGVSIQRHKVWTSFVYQSFSEVIETSFMINVKMRDRQQQVVICMMLVQ